jgi:hypothetical protein
MWISGQGQGQFLIKFFPQWPKPRNPTGSSRRHSGPRGLRESHGHSPATAAKEPQFSLVTRNDDRVRRRRYRGCTIHCQCSADTGWLLAVGVGMVTLIMIIGESRRRNSMAENPKTIIVKEYDTSGTGWSQIRRNLGICHSPQTSVILTTGGYCGTSRTRPVQSLRHLFHGGGSRLHQVPCALAQAKAASAASMASATRDVLFGRAQTATRPARTDAITVGVRLFS